MNAPRQRVNAMIDEIICGGYLGAQQVEGIHQYRKHLQSLKETVENAKTKLNGLSKRAVPMIRNKSMDEITSLVQVAAHRVRKGAESAELSQEVSRIITEKTTSILEQEFREILKDFDRSMVSQKSYSSKAGLRVDAKTETIVREVYDIRTVARDPDGVLEHVEHWL